MTQIEGLANFRDVGDFPPPPPADGGVTRTGVLYRSDAPATLTETGLEQLAANPVGIVVELRTPAERERAPDRLPTSRPIHVVELSILKGATGELTCGLAAGTP